MAGAYCSGNDGGNLWLSWPRESLAFPGNPWDSQEVPLALPGTASLKLVFLKESLGSLEGSLDALSGSLGAL